MSRSPRTPVPPLAPLLIPCCPHAPSVSPRRTPDLGGIQFAVVQLEDLQGSLEVGLWLEQFQLDWPQAVNAGWGQVHPEQGQIHLSHTQQATHVRLAATLPEPPV